MSDAPEVNAQELLIAGLKDENAALRHDSMVTYGLLSRAPSVHEVLARPQLYEEWLKEAQEILNGQSS